MVRCVLLACCLLLACVPPSHGFADPSDCGRFLKSKVPYQLTFLNEADKVVPYQIYRADNLFKHQLFRQGSTLVIVGFQANFPIVMMGRDGKTKLFEWNVPTSKYFFDAGISKARAVTRVDGKVVSDVEQTFTLLGEEPITVGRCTFATKHYTIDFDQEKGIVRSEFWLSPELQAALRWRHDVVTSGGVKRVFTSNVLSIQTDFIPFQ